jgi:putative tryptophan/tyrosine transport system ATP-binding protein
MIELTHIDKTFNKGKPDEVPALKDISLSIRKGEFVVLIGSNGSGKTTLLNIIAGAAFPSGGSVCFDNKDVTRLPEHRRSRWIARVFQNPLSGTAPDLSILDNFRLAALRTGRKRLTIGINEAFARRVRDRIATLGMGLENKVDQPMGSLSGGQRQALTLLMSVMDNTEILLLDEPTAALDPRSARSILQTAEQLIREFHLTTIFITHTLKDAHQYGNRLIQMAEGKIVRDMDAAAKNQLSVTDLFGWFD